MKFQFFFKFGAALLALLVSFALSATSSAQTLVDPGSPGGVNVVYSGYVSTSGTDQLDGTSANAVADVYSYFSDPSIGASINNAATTVILVPMTPTSGTVTITFSQPVDNPVLHIDRQGGAYNGRSNSSIWTLTTAGVTMSRLSGNPQFAVSSTTFQRSPTNTSVTPTANCGTTSTAGTACGSIQLTGSNITSLTFNVSFAGPSLWFGTTTDELEFAWTFPGASIRVGKITEGAVGGPFGFTYSNAAPAPASISTSAAGVVTYTSSGYAPISDHGATVTVSEPTVSPGFAFKSVTCVNDTTGVTVINNQTSVSTASITTGIVGSASNMYDPGDRLTCTFTNIKRPSLQLIKSVINDNGGTATTANWTLSAAGATPVTNVTSGTTTLVDPGTYTLSESAGPTGYVASPYSCVINGAAAVSGNSITLSAGNVAVCTITNNDSNQTSLSVSKSDGQTTVAAGSSVTYSIVISNSGPAPANGATLNERPVTGLTNCSVTGSSSTGGASAIPTGSAIAAGGTNFTIASMPANSSTTIQVTCTVAP